MPHLNDNPAARRMHGIGHTLPALDRFLGIEAGNICVTLALMRNGRCLSDDQPSP
jgi:hypothetical protein